MFLTSTFRCCSRFSSCCPGLHISSVQLCPRHHSTASGKQDRNVSLNPITEPHKADNLRKHPSVEYAVQQLEDRLTSDTDSHCQTNQCKSETRNSYLNATEVYNGSCGGNFYAENIATLRVGQSNKNVSLNHDKTSAQKCCKSLRYNLQHSSVLTLHNIRNALLTKTLQVNNCVTRTYSQLCSASRNHVHRPKRSQGRLRRLLERFGNSISCGELFKRTNYMGHWDGPDYRKKPPWRVMFFGTDFIALDTLQVLCENMKGKSPVIETLDVVTIKAKKPVRQYAKREGLQRFDWPIIPDNSRYDVGVLVSFGHMIPESIIHMFPYGILNMHPSILPRWRGASPIIHAVMAGDRQMGVSITEIRPRHFDIGPILMQRAFPMPDRRTSLEVADRLGKIGAGMVLETLQDLPTLERHEHEQDERGVTYAHKLTKQNGYIDWENSTAQEVDNQYRALLHIVPVRTKWKDTIVSLHDVVDPEKLKDAQSGLHPRYKGNIDKDLPGTPVWHRDLECIVIKCKEGLVGFKMLTLKRHLSAKDFHNGYLNAWDGTRFTSVHNELYRYVKREKIPIKSAM